MTPYGSASTCLAPKLRGNCRTFGYRVQLCAFGKGWAARSSEARQMREGEDA